MKIEKGIPIPNGSWSRVKMKYPWAEMDVGDSVYVDALGDKQKKTTVMSAAS